VRGNTFWGLVLASPIIIGIVVLGAFKLGLIDASIVRPVLFATYAAFFAGALGYHWLMRWIYRKFYRGEDAAVYGTIRSMTLASATATKAGQ
jgi:hypothetical protein